MKVIVYGICLLFILSGSAPARDAHSVRIDVLAKTDSSWDGNPLPGYAEGVPEITILKITIPPHTELPLHMHPEISAGVLLEGELTVVTKDGKILDLNTGEAIVEVVDTWHSGVNKGDNPAEIVVFYVGIKDMPITMKK